MPTSSARSFLFDGIGLVAAGGAVYGIMRNQPNRRGVWQLFAVALILFAAGDVVFDVAHRGFGQANGFPFSDLLYLPAYPLVAVALIQLARTRFKRETTIDSAIVAVALSAVIWQSVVTPVLHSANAATFERLVSVAYPTMDILLVVVIVHAVFTLPRWTPAAWFLFLGLGVMLVVDTAYARLVADGNYSDGGAIDVLWPIAYLLLAAAVMHPSMRRLSDDADPGIVRHGRARMVVLGAALVAAPLALLLDDTGAGSTVVLGTITAFAAVAVAWRVCRLVDDSNRARVVLAESEARFRALVQHAASIITVVTPDGRIAYMSPSVDTFFDTPHEDLVGTSFADLLDADGVTQALELYDTLVEHPDQPVTTEFHVFDGRSWRWVEATWTNQLDEPAVRGVVGNLREITQRKRAAAFADAETRVLELILSGAPVPETLTVLVAALEEYVPDGVGSVRLLDPETGALEAAAAPSLAFDYVQAIREHTSVEHIRAALSTTDLHIMRDLAAEGSNAAATELCLANGLRGLWSIPIRTPDNTEFLGLLTLFIRNVREPEDAELAAMERVRHLIAVAVDRDARTRQLGHLALHDILTGLPNRALAQDRLEHALARLANREDGSMVAVLFIDLDRFKLVNDGLGHEAGDELLMAVSDRLNTCVRRQDTIARFGGDEFVVLCEDLTGEHQAEELAERAARAFAEPFVLTNAEVTVSASIGIAVTDRKSERAASLLHDADAAMYRAKRRGGARQELFDEAMHTQAVSRMLTARALRRALEQDELRILFQPQFDLGTGKRVALEALLRWQHPVRGLVRPGDFLKVADETGIIVPIGEWVLQRGVRAVASLQDRRSRRHPAGDLDQRVVPPAPTTRLPGSRGPRRARPGHRPRDALPGDRGELAARRPRRDPRHAPRAQGRRRAARDRRLRHRRVVAHVPPAVPVRRAQGRPHVHRGARAQRGRRRDRRRHHRHGPRARDDRGGRGRRDRGTADASARVGLRPSARLPPRRAGGDPIAPARVGGAAARVTCATPDPPLRRRRRWACSTRSRRPRRRVRTSPRKASRSARTSWTSRSSRRRSVT